MWLHTKFLRALLPSSSEWCEWGFKSSNELYGLCVCVCVCVCACARLRLVFHWRPSAIRRFESLPHVCSPRTESCRSPPLTWHRSFYFIHSEVPFAFITIYSSCQDDITAAMVQNPFKNKYYFTYSLLLHSLFNPPTPPQWHGPRLWLLNDLKISPSIQFCGSRSSIVSADVARNKHGAWEHNAVVFCLCAWRLSFCLFPRELICTCGTFNTCRPLVPPPPSSSAF
jgi:hypothetical protein